MPFRIANGICIYIFRYNALYGNPGNKVNMRIATAVPMAGVTTDR